MQSDLTPQSKTSKTLTTKKRRESKRMPTLDEEDKLLM